MILPVEMPTGFGSPGGLERMPDEWWTAFEDPQLNRWVKMALAENLTLASAWERLRAARALARRAGAELYPELDGFGNAETRRAGSEGWNDRFELGLAAEYEVDLWGRISSQAEAEQFRAEASRLDYKAAALTLSAEVALVWFELLESRGQEAILSRQIEANANVLRLLEVRFGTGQVRSADILRQQQLLEATQADLLSVRSRTAVLQNLLAVLLGRSPEEGVDYLIESLPAPPGLPETGLPTELLERRPDVLAALNRVRAADSEVAAAVADRYPRLSIGAGFSTGGENISDLFDEWITSLAVGLMAPIIDGGARVAEVDRTRAEAASRLYQYGDKVLTALREVEDSLSLGDYQAQRINSVEKQRSLAEETLRRLQTEYFNGVGDYIDVLVAQTNEQRLQRELLLEKRRLLDFRVGLYRSLAGGFETPREEEISEERDDT